MKYRMIEVGELVDLRQGFAINSKSKHLISNEITKYPLLRIADMKNGSKEIFIKENIPTRFLAGNNDLIYTRTGNVGLVFKKQFGVVHNNCFMVRSKDKMQLDQRYLFNVLRSKSFYEKANSLARGAAQPDLPHNLFKSIEIPLPILEVQQRIASILSRYDDLIENYQQQIKLLEETAQRLYKEWFVDLHFPGYENIKTVDGVPEGWEKNAVSSILRLLSGYAFKSSTFESEGKYKIVTIKNVQDNDFETNNTNTILEIPSAMPLHCILKTGDILLSLTGNVGRSCVVVGDNYLLNQRVAKVQTKYPMFVHCLFHNRDFYLAMCNLANGAAQLNLSPIKTEGIKVLIPSKQKICEFEQLIEPLFNKKICLYKSITFLTEARDRLLPKLMSGEIEV